MLQSGYYTTLAHLIIRTALMNMYISSIETVIGYSLLPCPDRQDQSPIATSFPFQEHQDTFVKRCDRLCLLDTIMSFF
jgi:hypothetical protein